MELHCKVLLSCLGCVIKAMCLNTNHWSWGPLQSSLSWQSNLTSISFAALQHTQKDKNRFIIIRHRLKLLLRYGGARWVYSNIISDAGLLSSSVLI